jgi:mannosylglycerate hydrolase
MAKSKTAIVVPHTHWDREWRYPLWKNRLELVDMMEELLDTLENDPDFACFVMDGQVVVVEDYLEMRPEQTARVEKLVRQRRLVVGPWYTLPDLYPLDGECLARNLLTGIRVSRKYGGHLEVGYNSFGWGQTAQFPQFYKEFGFDFLIAAKRVSKQRAPDCEFLWRGPDGTELLTTRLGEYARANLYFFGYIPIRHGVDYKDDEHYRLKWEESGLIVHNAAPDRCHEDYFRLRTPEAYHDEYLKEAFQAAWDSMDETLVPDYRLIMNGSDFTDCQPSLTRMLKDANEVFDDIEWKHGSLEEAAEGMKQRLDRSKLKVVTGELRDGPACNCSANALTTRMYIKLMNKQAENSLIRNAEPLTALLSLNGLPYPNRFIDRAWNYLLKSHPHDSINGVTQDTTADDTVDRLRQVLQISGVLRDQAMTRLAEQIDLSGFDAEDILLLLANPSPRPRREMLELAVDTPREMNVWNFELDDLDGKRLPVQTLSRTEVTCPVNDLTARPWPFRIVRHMVRVDPGELPAGGYKVLKVVPTERFNRLAEWWPPMRTSRGDELSQAPDRMENEFLRVLFRSDGTLDLTDKTTGRTFTGLHVFEDGGDVGDYWAHYPPYEDEIYTSAGRPARVRREQNGPLGCVFTVEVQMDLPAACERPVAGVRGRSRRVDERRRLTVTSRFTLRRGARRLDVRTTVDNTVADHRLRLLCPTDLEATVSHACGHFTVDERPVEPQGEFYPDMLTHPQQMFVDLSDGEAGLAVVNRSFTEFEALRDDRRTLAITLFRSLRNLVCTEFRSSGAFPMQKGGQSLREMTFDYALYPHAGDWAKAEVYKQAEEFNTDVEIYQTARHGHGDWPLRRSLFRVRPANLILSALKKAADRESFILRVYNPTSETLVGDIDLPGTPAGVWRTDMNEQRRKRLEVEGGRLRLEVPRGKIVTIELEEPMQT